MIVFEQVGRNHGGAFDQVAERDIAGDIPVRICFNQEVSESPYGHRCFYGIFKQHRLRPKPSVSKKLDDLQRCVGSLMDVSFDGGIGPNDGEPGYDHFDIYQEDP